MASDDFSGVTVAFNQASYTPGQTMTLSVNGSNVHTSDPTTTTQTGSVDVAIVADGSNATTVIHSSSATITTSVPGATTNENVKIVAVTGFGKTWTVAADGKTATAVA